MTDQTERDGQDGMEISRIHQLISHKYLSSENPLCLAGVSGGVYIKCGGGGGGGVDLALGATVTDCRRCRRRTVTASGR